MVVTPQYLRDGDKIPYVYYRVCPTSDLAKCTISASNGQLATGMTNSTGTVENNERIILIDHDPEECPNTDSCMYTFAVHNNNT